jgi:hypothetical protein
MMIKQLSSELRNRFGAKERGMGPVVNRATVSLLGALALSVGSARAADFEFLFAFGEGCG